MAAKWMPEGAPPPVAQPASKAAAKAVAEQFAPVFELVTGMSLDKAAYMGELAAKAALAEVSVEAGELPKASTMQDNASKLISLDQQIDDAEKLLAALEAKRKMVEEALTEQFVEAGVQNVKMMGRTVFLARSIYCSIPAETMSELVEVLDKEGVGESLAPRTVTAARIKGLLKEDEAKWSEKLKGLISTGEKFNIRNRSAS